MGAHKKPGEPLSRYARKLRHGGETVGIPRRAANDVRRSASHETRREGDRLTLDTHSDTDADPMPVRADGLKSRENAALARISRNPTAIWRCHETGHLLHTATPSVGRWNASARPPNDLKPTGPAPIDL